MEPENSVTASPRRSYRPHITAEVDIESEDVFVVFKDVVGANTLVV